MSSSHASAVPARTSERSFSPNVVELVSPVDAWRLPPPRAVVAATPGGDVVRRCRVVAGRAAGDDGCDDDDSAQRPTPGGTDAARDAGEPSGGSCFRRKPDRVGEDGASARCANGSARCASTWLRSSETSLRSPNERSVAGSSESASAGSEAAVSRVGGLTFLSVRATRAKLAWKSVSVGGFLEGEAGKSVSKREAGGI